MIGCIIEARAQRAGALPRSRETPYRLEMSIGSANAGREGQANDTFRYQQGYGALSLTAEKPVAWMSMRRVG